MARIRGKHTKPEIRVRRLVYAIGYRYRLHTRDLPGRPDLTFRSRRKVIFVHGCFWHRHDDAACRLARMPKSRLDFWRPKLEGNRARDKRVMAELIGTGWQALTIWECQLKDVRLLEARIREFLDG